MELDTGVWERELTDEEVEQMYQDWLLSSAPTNMSELG